MISEVFSIKGSEELPPLWVKKTDKQKDSWKKAVMDSFERIGISQLHENKVYSDIYRMIDGKMPDQNFSDIAPYLGKMEELLDSVGIPTWIKHYDFLGEIKDELVGRYMDLQDKFSVIDVSEIGSNEFQEHLNSIIQKATMEAFDKEIEIGLAQRGITIEGKQFNSQEEQQAFLQQLEEEKKKIVSPERLKALQNTYKNAGADWAQGTLDKDSELFGFHKMEEEEITSIIVSGKAFREIKVNIDNYQPKTWDIRNTFTSKEVSVKSAENLSYIGRSHVYTPAELVRQYGHRISAKKQREILSGNADWKGYVSSGFAAGSLDTAIRNNFNEIREVPFKSYYDYNQALGLQDEFGIPLGEQVDVYPDGSSVTSSRFLPNMRGDYRQSTYSYISRILRPDIINHRQDLVHVTEVYFIAYDLIGYLTYEDPESGRPITELVTEDIYQDFLKTNNITSSIKMSRVDLIKEFPINTLQWFYTENTYEGTKIQAPWIEDSIYFVEKMDFQIPGESMFHRKLPVGGIIGQSILEKILPLQAKYNLCKNQEFNLLEKELGSFALMSLDLLATEDDEEGDSEDALIRMRNNTKSVGIMMVPESGDEQNGRGLGNKFQTYNLSHAQEIQTRVQVAQMCKSEAFTMIGLTAPVLNQPSKQETAQGVQTNQELSFARLSRIFETFSTHKKSVLNIHIDVAQYCQANNIDKTLYYTKSDSSMRFLGMFDENLPLRKFGIVATENYKKRSAFEAYKSMLLQNNTMGADAYDLSKLFFSDDVQELMKVVERIRQTNDQNAAIKQQQALQEIQAKTEQMKTLQDEVWKKEKYKIDTDAYVKLRVGQLNAEGRAADKQADPESFQNIQDTATNAIEQLGLELDYEKEMAKIKSSETANMRAMDQKEKELMLKAQQLKLKKEEIDSKERIAMINPS